MAASAPCHRAVAADAAPAGAVLDSVAHLERKRAPALETRSHGLCGDEAGQEGDERNRQLHCVWEEVLASWLLVQCRGVHFIYILRV